MPEYRPISTDRRAEFDAVLRQAFAAERGPGSDPPDENDWPPELSDPRGLFADDELVTVCKLYHLEATIRGEWTRIGGLGGVATPPEHRREGYARQLLRNALEEYRADGVDLVALWPATVRFYRSLGWGTANRIAEADVPPKQLRDLAEATTDWRVRELDVDDWEQLRGVEEARAERFGLSLRRSERWWRERTLATWPDEPRPYVYGLEERGTDGLEDARTDGDLLGYCLLEVESADDGPVLLVQDLAAVDRDAQRALLGFLGNFDSQVESVRLRGPIARDVLEFVPDPDAADVELDATESPMVRLIDVARGLSSLAWPADVDAEVVLDVDDPLFDSNDGAFAVEVADGEAAVERLDGADPTSAADGTDPTSAADARLDVGALSRLAVGAISVERAIDLGAFELRREAARDDLAAAFPAEPVCLRAFF